ncbi:MAG: hypothetical protein ABIH18_08450 [Candidatus Omnitrophota bacterium]
MEKIIHKCMVKATKKEGENIHCSLNWAFARRGRLYVMSDSLKCRDWKIPYSEIEESIIYSIPWLFTHAYVLLVKSKGQIYQFGLNPGRFWKDDFPFPVKREKIHNKYWNIVNIIRFIIFGWLAFWIISGIIKKLLPA